MTPPTTILKVIQGEFIDYHVIFNETVEPPYDYFYGVSPLYVKSNNWPSFYKYFRIVDRESINNIYVSRIILKCQRMIKLPFILSIFQESLGLDVTRMLITKFL